MTASPSHSRRWVARSCSLLVSLCFASRPQHPCKQCKCEEASPAKVPAPPLRSTYVRLQGNLSAVQERLHATMFLLSCELASSGGLQTVYLQAAILVRGRRYHRGEGVRRWPRRQWWQSHWRAGFSGAGTFAEVVILESQNATDNCYPKCATLHP